MKKLAPFLLLLLSMVFPSAQAQETPTPREEGAVAEASVPASEEIFHFPAVRAYALDFLEFDGDNKPVRSGNRLVEKKSPSQLELARALPELVESWCQYVLEQVKNAPAFCPGASAVTNPSPQDGIYTLGVYSKQNPFHFLKSENAPEGIFVLFQNHYLRIYMPSAAYLASIPEREAHDGVVILSANTGQINPERKKTLIERDWHSRAFSQDHLEGKGRMNWMVSSLRRHFGTFVEAPYVTRNTAFLWQDENFRMSSLDPNGQADGYFREVWKKATIDTLPAHLKALIDGERFARRRAEYARRQNERSNSSEGR